MHAICLQYMCVMILGKIWKRLVQPVLAKSDHIYEHVFANSSFICNIYIYIYIYIYSLLVMFLLFKGLEDLRKLIHSQSKWLTMTFCFL